ncbi:uncharacterized protein CANTADRAFT_47147 [Suhomyces tanzawaensis NRRL Y-17324]|uniref:CAP-Gly domain-containing protein n=1 Tax=Suhomyces tanzawaensis NRRL Y-17324 TaxID=984487 RepID=A0A1E4SMI5_9ASCO|nr:uncharacterized protein CANTADRAFT_47147 [Suhomyces tanzawaensis NRRL Y-17324]ODV80723.1 hypothetical protein CANTADRAFT_47147 [Suhomyces tanzawaensis NRRL Y-17324]
MADYIDTKVVVPGTRGHGILRYYGAIRGKNGVFAGIELIGPTAATRGKNSGDVEGIQYFRVEIPLTGLFLPIDRLAAVNPHLVGLALAPPSSRNSISSMPSMASSTANHSKTAILNELRATVDEIQPLLQDYEVQLSEKDKKMTKQKADFERAREEWRESIDLMSIAHQENEAYYEKQVDLINEKLLALAKESEEAAQLKLAGDEEIAKLMLQIDDLKMEIIMAEKKTLQQRDLEGTVDELKHELSIRPTFNELVDLQTSLDELETLHKKELDSTEQELRRVIGENKDLQKKLEQVLTEQVENAKKEISDRELEKSLGDEEESLALPIYSPGKVDPSAGKNDWCGLCERDGHSSINCPYENDIF